jgi:hypothetical protein
MSSSTTSASQFAAAHQSSHHHLGGGGVPTHDQHQYQHQRSATPHPCYQRSQQQLSHHQQQHYPHMVVQQQQYYQQQQQQQPLRRPTFDLTRCRNEQEQLAALQQQYMAVLAYRRATAEVRRAEMQREAHRPLCARDQRAMLQILVGEAWRTATAAPTAQGKKNARAHVWAENESNASWREVLYEVAGGARRLAGRARRREAAAASSVASPLLPLGPSSPPTPVAVTAGGGGGGGGGSLASLPASFPVNNRLTSQDHTPDDSGSDGEGPMNRGQHAPVTATGDTYEAAAAKLSSMMLWCPALRRIQYEYHEDANAPRLALQTDVLRRLNALGTLFLPVPPVVVVPPTPAAATATTPPAVSFECFVEGAEAMAAEPTWLGLTDTSASTSVLTPQSTDMQPLHAVANVEQPDAAAVSPLEPTFDPETSSTPSEVALEDIPSATASTPDSRGIAAVSATEPNVVDSYCGKEESDKGLLPLAADATPAATSAADSTNPTVVSPGLLLPSWNGTGSTTAVTTPQVNGGFFPMASGATSIDATPRPEAELLLLASIASSASPTTSASPRYSSAAAPIRVAMADALALPNVSPSVSPCSISPPSILAGGVSAARAEACEIPNVALIAPLLMGAETPSCSSECRLVVTPPATFPAAVAARPATLSFESFDASADRDDTACLFHTFLFAGGSARAVGGGIMCAPEDSIASLAAGNDVGATGGPAVPPPTMTAGTPPLNSGVASGSFSASGSASLTSPIHRAFDSSAQFDEASSSPSRCATAPTVTGCESLYRKVVNVPSPEKLLPPTAMPPATLPPSRAPQLMRIFSSSDDSEPTEASLC